MGILKSTGLLTLTIAGTACYSPELLDCTLTCSTSSDCAEGQVCGDDQFCVSRDRAQRCDPSRDGGVDAVVIVSDVPPDAPAFAMLQLQIEGHGDITVDGVGSCNADCMLAVPYAKPALVEANAASDWMFDKWTTPLCASSQTTCVVTPFGPTLVGVKFRKDD